MGTRAKAARSAREAVQRRILEWIAVQPGTKQALCRRLRLSASQLQALVNDGVERCSLEYLLDVWERCGGSYSLMLGTPAKVARQTTLSVAESSEGIDK